MMPDLNLFTFSLCSIPFLLFLFFLLRLPRSAASRRLPGSPAETPCPESHPLLGNLLGFLRNRHRFHDWIADMLLRTPSSTIRVNTFLGLSQGVCTANPLNLQHLLSSNFPNYVKGSRYHAVLRELLGDGIFAVDGHLWSLQRKVASHEFTTRSLKHFISETVCREISDRLLPFLSRACHEGRIVDLQETLQRFTFDNICSVAFGVDPDCFAAEEASDLSARNSAFVKAFDEAVENCSLRFMSPLPAVWKLKRFFNIGSEKRFKSNIRLINEFAMDIIKSKEERIESATEREKSADGDLLSRFMSSSTDMEFRDLEEKRKFLRDIVISFVLAGKDSTSTALTWFFWLIAAHRSCERKILEELSASAAAAAASSTTSEVKIFSYDELKSLHYLHAAVTESMRLFPPVPINSRLVVEDDVWPDGTRVRKGWFADYSAYAMGRNEEVWGPKCREFQPERWLDGGYGDGDDGENQDVRFRPTDQWKYPVFHCGPRMCLGKEMAYVQMKSAAAAVMAEFEVSPVNGGESVKRTADPPPYTLSLLLKMRGGLPIRLRRRRRRRRRID